MIDRMVHRRKTSLLLTAAMLAALVSVVPSQTAGASSDVTPIYEIQGAGHVSPFVGAGDITTEGVVTAIGFRSFWVQDPTGDGDNATSDGISVFDSRGATFSTIAVGTCVRLVDDVEEFIPGGFSRGGLSTTQMAFPDITVIDCESTFSDYSFPAPVVIGEHGRKAPNEVVISEDELPVDLRTDAGDFNPEEDGIDFYESLENMLVTVESPQAVSAMRQFGSFSAEFFAVPNNGDDDIVSPEDAMTKRGGIFLQPDPDNRGDQNPERVQIQLSGSPLYPGSMRPPAAVKVGDRLGDITGVMGYNFGNFEIHAMTDLVITDRGLAPETTKIKGDKDRVTVLTYNVLNLSPGSSDDAQRDKLASQIVDVMHSPDVIAVQEIQDNSGTTDDGVTSADETLLALTDAIAAAGGPSYESFDVAPADGTGGGVPGGNIRNAFLYNPARVGLVDFVSLTPSELAAAGVANTAAFTDTRTPLMATFEFNTREFSVINLHLTSRFGSTPIFGGPQPFVQAGEAGGAGREDQVGAINEYVDSLLAADSGREIMVAGDFNTFEWTNDLTEILPGTGDERVLNNIVAGEEGKKDDDHKKDDHKKKGKKDKGEDHSDDDDDDGMKLGDDAEYTFIFDGNSQQLDQFFTTDGLADDAKVDVVHLNVDFSRRFDDVTASDHDPILASFKMKLPKDMVKLQVLTVSDWHGQLDPLFVFRQGSFGGAAELSTYFQRERANIANTLTLTAGDAYGAAPPLSNFFDEEPAVRAMRLMGFDADTFGNHNFDAGITHLQSMIDIANDTTTELGNPFQYVSANLQNRDDNLTGVKDYELFALDGVKVAVIGVTNPEAPTLVFPGSFGTIVITDPIAAANSARAAAAAEGAEVFILLAHMGITGAGPSGPLIDLANGVSGFDLIVGDHTDEEFSAVINGATVVENQSKGRTYARIQMTYDRAAGTVIAARSNFVKPVSGNVVPDPAIVALLAPLRTQLDALLGNVLGTSTVAILRSDECGQSSGRSCESLVGNVVTDAMRSRYGTDFAITNAGGLRSPLTCPTADIPGDFCNPGDEGSITAGQVLTVLPFGNSVVTLTMNGADLKAHLERGVSAMPGISGRFAQVSGLCVTYDIEAAVGSRIMSAVRQVADGTCTGAPVDLTVASSYTVAENDFTSSGGDGYPADISTANTRELLDQVTAAYVTANTPISPAIQGRITCVDANPGAGNDCPVPVP